MVVPKDSVRNEGYYISPPSYGFVMQVVRVSHLAATCIGLYR